MKKIVVYSANFGGYDDLIDPPYDSNCDFVYFTDSTTLMSNIYEIRPTSPQDENSCRSAKIFKILPHRFFPNYEYSVWIDANLEVSNLNFTNMVEVTLTKHNFATLEHPENDGVYDEIIRCIKLKKEDPDILRELSDRYTAEGLPTNTGLATLSFIIRRHNDPQIIQFDELWWKEIINGSKRDQISFNYLAWKTNLKYRVIEKQRWGNFPGCHETSFSKARLHKNLTNASINFALMIISKLIDDIMAI